MGSCDSVAVIGAHFEGLQAGSNQFEKALASSFSIEDRGDTEHVIDADETFQVFSGIIKRTTAAWLKELYTSSLVFVENANKDFVPVIILNKDGYASNSLRRPTDLPLFYVKANQIKRQVN